MAYVQIATESHSFVYEDGSVHAFDYTILQEGASQQSLPVGLVGDVTYIFGKKGDDPHKFIKPTQIHFRIRDKNKELLNLLRGSKDTDFRLRIEENASEIFDGYLNLQSKSWTYYKQTPVVELVAYAGLGTLQGVRFEGDVSGLTTFDDYLDALLGLTGFTRDRLVYVRKNHENVSSADYWPDQYRHQVDHILRSKQLRERFAWDALVEFCARFGLQCFYWQGKYILMEREQRVRFPATQEKYDSSDDSNAQQDLTISAGRAETIRYPAGEDTEGVSRVVYNWNITQPAVTPLQNKDFVDSAAPWNLTGLVTWEPTLPTLNDGYLKIPVDPGNSAWQDIAVLTAGDQVDIWLTFHHRQDDDGTAADYDCGFLQLKLKSLDSATELYAQSDGSWDTGVFTFFQAFDYPDTPTPQSDTIPFVVGLDHIPSDNTDKQWELEVRLKAEALTVRSGTPSPYHVEHTYARDEVQANRSGLATKQVIVSTPDTNAQELEIEVSLGDVDSVAPNIFAMQYWTGSDWTETGDWSSGTGLAPLQFLVALGLAAQQNGPLETINLRSRFPVGFTPLHTIDFDTEDGILRCIPNYFKRGLHSGYLEIQAQEGKFDTAGLTIEANYLDEDGNPTPVSFPSHQPAAPAALVVTSYGGGEVVLDWDDNVESDIAFYYVYLAGEDDPINATFNPTSTITMQRETIFSECYEVTAVNEIGIESERSNIDCGVLDDLTCVGPTSLYLYQKRVNQGSCFSAPTWNIRDNCEFSHAFLVETGLLTLNISAESSVISTAGVRGFFIAATYKDAQGNDHPGGEVVLLNESEAPPPGHTNCALLSASTQVSLQSSLSDSGVDYSLFQLRIGYGSCAVACTGGYLEIQGVLSKSEIQQPEPPQNLVVVSSGNGQVELDWDDLASPFDTYTLYAFNNDSFTQEQVITGLTSSEHTVTGLTNGDEYDFWMRSVLGGLESADSNHVTATPSDTALPLTLDNTMITLDSTTITLDQTEYIP